MSLKVQKIPSQAGAALSTITTQEHKLVARRTTFYRLGTISI